MPINASKLENSQPDTFKIRTLSGDGHRGAPPTASANSVFRDRIEILFSLHLVVLAKDISANTVKVLVRLFVFLQHVIDVRVALSILVGLTFLSQYKPHNLPENALDQFTMNVLFVKQTRLLWYKGAESKDDICNRPKQQSNADPILCTLQVADGGAIGRQARHDQFKSQAPLIENHLCSSML
jgi:hypothetical protein